MQKNLDGEAVKYIDGRLWLQQEFYLRRQKNSRFSLRAFAKALAMDSSTLSKILTGKRKLTVKLISKICKQLHVERTIEQQLIDGLNAPIGAKIFLETPVFKSMGKDTFAAIADHHHTAIMAMCDIRGVKNDPSLIADLLDLDVKTVREAIDRLLLLSLLEEKNGRLIRAQSYISNETFPGVTSKAHKEFQRQLIKRSLQAIDRVEPDQKDITSITMAIDPRRLPEAREVIKKFRRELCAFLSVGKVSQVYNLGVQLVPLSKSVGEK